MKKQLLSFTLFFLFCGITAVYSQAKKMVLFEHFTNASCNPCALQNPGFENDILKKNKGRVLHVAYHTSWPGVDPMNAYNATEIQSRVSYYSVTGVPNVKMQGNKYSGGPAGVTNSMIDNEAMIPSPLRIKVKEMPNGGITRNVEVVVYSVDTLPSGTYKLRTAVVEREKTYTSAPGLNGETYFPNIFRKFLNTATGEVFSASSIGDSIVYNFTYSLDTAVWDTTQIYIVAFVQDDANKYVINAGSNYDPQWEFVPMSNIYQAGLQGVATNFLIDLNNFAAVQDSFRIVMSYTQPADWAVSYTYNSQVYTDTAIIVLNPETTTGITLNVIPGATSGIGSYIFKINSLSDTSLAAQKLQFFVSRHVTDIIVNNDGSWGTGGDTTAKVFEQNYIDGLTLAGNTSFGTISLQPFLTAAKLGLLDSIESIFYNVSWAFPSLTDAYVAVFKPFLDGGGKMFISGQDIGWETYASTNGTGQTKLFYSNYLGANYIADGDLNNNNIHAFANDPIFGTVSTSSVVNVYGGSNMYPDVISARPVSFPVFYYNDSAKVACVRSNSPIFKTVYLSVSLEMISDINVRKQIIKLSNDWFKGFISGVEFETLINKALLGQNYPNPAQDNTTITFSDLNSDAVLEILDITGRVVDIRKISKGTNNISINTTHYQSGTYFYRLVTGDRVEGVKKMVVVR